MKKIIVIIFLFFLCYPIFYFLHNSPRTLDFNSQKIISLNDNGFIFTAATKSETVDNFLQENKLSPSDYDQIIPEKNTLLYTGTNIIIKRAIKIKIAADGQKKEFFTLAGTVGDAIIDSGIALGEDDLVNPKITASLQNNLQISITRVEIREEVLQKPIDFKTISREDDSLGWRTKKIQQKGIRGAKEIRYRVVSHDSREISRKVLGENIIREPTPEIAVQGTYMKLGKASRGDASHYALGWGELNASRSIPRGGFAKVTNLDNGKSVVVKINDYGPQTPQRIIDLSHASFLKIGDIVQGVLHNVKVEQILN